MSFCHQTFVDAFWEGDDDDPISIIDCARALERSTSDVSTMSDALNVWLRAKAEFPENSPIRHAIDACCYLRMYHSLRDTATPEHLATFRQRMIQSWELATNDADGEEQNEEENNEVDLSSHMVTLSFERVVAG